MPGVYRQIVDKHTSLVKDLLPSRQSALCSVDFQPFPSVIGQHSEDSGGNAMGISGSDPHRVILELQCSWDEEVDDDLFQNATRTLVEWIDSKVPEWSDDGQAYLPLFMNDAAWDQNVTGTYKGYADFKRIQKVIDPTGFFPGRAGGFVY